jgi:hypothetical protein
MAVIHFDIDERRSVLSVDAWMRMAWNDNHLKWDPAEFDGLKQIHFGEHEIWRPDIQLYNRYFCSAFHSEEDCNQIFQFVPKNCPGTNYCPSKSFN